MAEGGIAEKIRPLAQRAVSAAARAGLRLWDVRFVKEGAGHYLRVFLDRDGGVAIQDCETVSKALGELLDEDDPIDGFYYLEVSSPGLGRELTRPEHFAAMAGREIRLRLIRPCPDGQREFRGALRALEGGEVVIESPDGGEMRFAQKAAAFVRLCDDEE